jgi:branched-chain amino acid transport system permease protein
MAGTVDSPARPVGPGLGGLVTVRPAGTVLRWGLVALALALLLLVPSFVPTAIVFVVNQLLIAALFAASLNLIMGYAGMTSFGHAAYYALGAYTAALVVKAAGVPFWVALPLGPVVAAAGALIAGYFCVRSTSAYFIMLTLAFAQLLYTVIDSWYSLTRGDDGLAGVFPGGFIASPAAFYRFSAVVVVLSLVVLYRIIESPFGLTMRAIGENPRRCQYLGLRTRRYQLAAFVLAGFFAGIAGTLFAFYNGSVSPQLAYWTESGQPFIAVVLGGPGSFWGALVGSAVLSLLTHEVASVTQYAQFWVGVVSLAVGLFFRQGLATLGLRERRP